MNLTSEPCGWRPSSRPGSPPTVPVNRGQARAIRDAFLLGSQVPDGSVRSRRAVTADSTLLLGSVGRACRQGRTTMGLLEKLRPQPKWKHADPAVRLEGLHDIDDADQDALDRAGDRRSGCARPARRRRTRSPTPPSLAADRPQRKRRRRRAITRSTATGVAGRAGRRTRRARARSPRSAALGRQRELADGRARVARSRPSAAPRPSRSPIRRRSAASPATRPMPTRGCSRSSGSRDDAELEARRRARRARRRRRRRARSPDRRRPTRC